MNDYALFLEHRGVATNRSRELTPQVGIVCFAFGVAQFQLGDPVAGPVLLRLLADLGISSSAGRSLLLRMRKEGWLTSERSGREARYRLAPAVGAAQTRLARQLRGERPAWPGTFSGILYTVPERSRAYRDRLRRAAVLLGYVGLRPGLLVAASDRFDELTALLPIQPPGSQLLPVTIALSSSDSCRIAAELWDLDAIAARCAAALTAAEDHISYAERQPQVGAAAFQAFAAATLPLFTAGAQDPDLPTELLPADWPALRISAMLGRAFQVFGPALHDYLAGMGRDRGASAA